MTFWDFIYIIGCCFAWIILLLAFDKVNEKLPRWEKGSFVAVLFGATLFAFLSWAVPFFWLWNEIYKRKFKR